MNDSVRRVEYYDYSVLPTSPSQVKRKRWKTFYGRASHGGRPSLKTFSCLGGPRQMLRGGGCNNALLRVYVIADLSSLYCILWVCVLCILHFHRVGNSFLCGSYFFRLRFVSLLLALFCCHSFARRIESNTIAVLFDR